MTRGGIDKEHEHEKRQEFYASYLLLPLLWKRENEGWVWGVPEERRLLGCLKHQINIFDKYYISQTTWDILLAQSASMQGTASLTQIIGIDLLKSYKTWTL